MKKEKIVEGNKLIAEFMNEKLNPAKFISDKTKGKSLWVDLVKRELGTEIPPYNLSWDWLMPVVEKCFSAKDNDVMDELTDSFDFWHLGKMYNAVVEYVKWCNSQV